jgi:hypothetical protein
VALDAAMNRPGQHGHIPGSLAYWRDLARQRDLDAHRLREHVAAAADRADASLIGSDMPAVSILLTLIEELRALTGGAS